MYVSFNPPSPRPSFPSSSPVLTKRTVFQTLPALKRKQAKERKKVADAREGEDEVPSDRPLRTKGPRSTRTSSRATSEAVLDPNRIIVEHDARAAGASPSLCVGCDLLSGMHS